MVWPGRIFPLTLIALVGLAASLKANNADDALRARELARKELLFRQRQHYEQSIKALPALAQHRMDEILRLRVIGGDLVAYSPLAPWADSRGRRAQIDGIKTPAIIVYTQFAPNQIGGRQFDITLEEYPDPDTFGRLHLLWHPFGFPRAGQLTIEHTEQTSHSFRRVLYVQGPQRAQLIVFSNADSAAGKLQSFNVAEKDFDTLRRKHAAEAERWMRPIFRRLMQDAAFAPDSNAAWQVLSSVWPTTDQTRRAVVKLLPALGSEDSLVRHRAADDLARLGRDGAAAILAVNRKGLSLEQKARLDEVISRFRRLPDSDARRLIDDPDFLLDCQYSDDPTVRKLAARRLVQVLGHPTGIDPDAPDNVRAAEVDSLRLELRQQGGAK